MNTIKTNTNINESKTTFEYLYSDEQLTSVKYGCQQKDVECEDDSNYLINKTVEYYNHFYDDNLFYEVKDKNGRIYLLEIKMEININNLNFDLSKTLYNRYHKEVNKISKKLQNEIDNFAMEILNKKLDSYKSNSYEDHIDYSTCKEHYFNPSARSILSKKNID